MLSLDRQGWWKTIAERVGRQLAQTGLPIALVAGAMPGGGDLKAAALAIAVSLVVTLLKAVAGLRASAADPLPVQLLDRAAPAFAGTLLGFIPADLADLGSVDWSHVLWAAVSAAVAAVAAYYFTPPSNVVAASVDPAVPGPNGLNEVPGEADLETEAIGEDNLL